MIFLTYDMTLLFFTASAAWVLFRLIRFGVHQKGSLLRELTLSVLFLLIWFLIQRTLEPFVLVLDRAPEPPNLIPLRGLILMVKRAIAVDQRGTWLAVLINVVGNVLMFAPVGFLVCVLTPNPHKGWLSLGIGLAVSLSIEIIQLSFIIRVFDVDDLILNAFGAWLGFLLFLIASRVQSFKDIFSQIAAAQRPRAWVFVLLYGAFLFAAAAGIYWKDYTAYLQIPQ